MELNSISESPNLEEMLKTTAKKLQSNSDDVIDINLEQNWNGCSLFGILLGFPCVYYYDVESSDQNCLSYAQLIQIQGFQYDHDQKLSIRLTVLNGDVIEPVKISRCVCPKSGPNRPHQT